VCETTRDIAKRLFLEATWSRPSAGWIAPSGDFYPLGWDEIHFDWVRRNKALVKKTGVAVDDAVQEGGWEEVQSDMLDAGWVRKADSSSYMCDKRFVRQVMGYVKDYEPEVAEVFLDLWSAGTLERSLRMIVR
jgi:hypothetical protein